MAKRSKRRVKQRSKAHVKLTKATKKKRTRAMGGVRAGMEKRRRKEAAAKRKKYLERALELELPRHQLARVLGLVVGDDHVPGSSGVGADQVGQIDRLLAV